MKRLLTASLPYRSKTGAQIITTKLKSKNVTDVFAYSGGAIMPTLDRISLEPSIRIYVPANEACAGHAATGYSRSGGRVGVVITTSGPGTGNLVSVLNDAKKDSTALVVFTGQVGTDKIGSNAFQEMDSVNTTKPNTKWSYMVRNVHELPYVIDTAFAVATTGKPGPVHIDLPVNITKAVFTGNCLKPRANAQLKSFHLETERAKQTQPLNAQEIAKIINTARSPIFYIGQGCNNAFMSLRLVATAGNIPVTTTLHAVGSFPENHRLSLKFLGMHGQPAANLAMQEADVVIAVGCRFDDRTTGAISKFLPKNPTVIHVTNDFSDLHTWQRDRVNKSKFQFHMDAGKFLNDILPFIKYSNRTTWSEQISVWKNLHPFRLPVRNNGDLSEGLVINCINKLIEPNTIITTGVGNHQMKMLQHRTFTVPKTFISSGGAGVMGFGLPAAIGCAIANPHKQVICFDGDGSLLMTGTDYHTIAKYDLNNIKACVCNNKAHGMVNNWENLFYQGNVAATSNKYRGEGEMNYSQFVNSFFNRNVSFKVSNTAHLESTIRAWLSFKGVSFLEIDLPESVGTNECWPLVPPGAALHEFIEQNALKLDQNMCPPS